MAHMEEFDKPLKVPEPTINDRKLNKNDINNIKKGKLPATTTHRKLSYSLT